MRFVVEGAVTDLPEGERALLVEDLTTDGRSKINFCQALRAAGARVDHVFVIFYYSIFEESKAILADLGVTLHCLATWWDVPDVAKKHKYFDARTLTEVDKFLHNPAEWSAAHGGVARFPSATAYRRAAISADLLERLQRSNGRSKVRVAERLSG